MYMFFYIFIENQHASNFCEIKYPVVKTLGIVFVGMSSFNTVGTFWPLSSLKPVLMKLVTLGFYYSILKKSRIESARIDLLQNCPIKR